jgi:hypothetical protein
MLAEQLIQFINRMTGVLTNGFVSFSICFNALSHFLSFPFQFHLPCVGLKQPPLENVGQLHEDPGGVDGQSMKEGPWREKPKWYVVN